VGVLDMGERTSFSLLYVKLFELFEVAVGMECFRVVPMPTSEKTPTRKPNAAFMKPVQPDEALAKIVGSTPIPRSEVTKKLWDYIKTNKLQDEKKKTQINADDALKAVFNGKSSVTMFEMTKLVSEHLKA